MADIPFLSRVSGFAAQPVTRQFALLIGMAASVALGVGVMQWAMNADYEPVYGAMAPSENATAITALEAAGIPYKLEQGTGLLTVPYEQVAQARMALASEGFSRGGGVGFESLYEEQQMGISSFMEQARYHRAIEAELARTITGMDTVRGARVHLAMAKQSAFVGRGQEPSASVMVSLFPGRTLKQAQLSGIIHLVASSVPNLDAANVSVVDQAGKLLSDQGQDDDFGYTTEQFRIRQQLENTMNGRIMAILSPILGPNKVSAQVAADMDFTRTESTSEQYDPQTILRSEQTSEDIANTFSGDAVGVPGQLTNQPPAALPPGLAPTEDDGPQPPARETRKATRNFEINKQVSHTKAVPGTLTKLSVAVVVDYVTDEAGVKVALAPERIQEITTLVREAVGFDEARGDTVSVINSPFVEPEALEEIPEPGLMEQDWIWQAARLGATLIAFLALLMMVVRPLIRYSTSYQAPIPATGNDQARLTGQTIDDDELGDDTLALSGQRQAALPAPTDRSYHQNIAMARNVANEQPARAAYVVKNWMSADGA